MSTIAADGPNAGQIGYWNDTAGRNWAELQADVDAHLRPLGRAAMDALAPRPGDTVIDVGCGSGGTSLELADRVGQTGRVFATDISEPQLRIAEARARTVPQMTCLLADAQTHAFPEGEADGVFSRFGVMFFADPTAAFANLRKALRPGGRLAFVCWRAAPFNPWMSGPFAAAVAVAPQLAPQAPADPHAPGPFAFADDERVRGILEAAGFQDIAIRAHDQMLGVGDVDETTAFVLRLGALGSALRDNPDLAGRVTGAVRELIAGHVTPDGVRMPGSVWLVTATK